MRLTAVALLALLAQAGNSALAQDLTLSLRRPLRAGETAFIEVQVGAIGRREIDVTTAAGAPLGTISPLGVRFGQEGGSYPLPVPRDAIRNGHLSIRLTIKDSGGSPRAPTAEEVRGVKLVVGGR
jgi:hypothetical protein